jgi:hypothetical protein
MVPRCVMVAVADAVCLGLRTQFQVEGGPGGGRKHPKTTRHAQAVDMCTRSPAPKTCIYYTIILFTCIVTTGVWKLRRPSPTDLVVDDGLWVLLMPSLQ